MIKVAHNVEIEMKPKYSAVFNQSNRDRKEFTGLSESQLVQRMLEQGFHTVSSITHQEASGVIRPVEAGEMISIWKQVYKSIQTQKN